MDNNIYNLWTILFKYIWVHVKPCKNIFYSKYTCNSEQLTKGLLLISQVLNLIMHTLITLIMWSFYETMQRSVQCWFIGMCAGINTYVQRQDTIGIWGCNLSNNYAMENDVHDKLHGANLDSKSKI